MSGSYLKLNVDPDEVLLRMFFRAPGQDGNVLSIDDFVRDVANGEGGISLWRTKLAHYGQINWIKKKESRFRGFAIAEARYFLEFGFTFHGDPNSPAHVCMHCAYCNNRESGCSATEVACPIEGNAPAVIRDQFAESQRIAVLIPAIVRAKELREVFRTDIGKDEPNANEKLMGRWREYQSASLGLPGSPAT